MEHEPLDVIIEYYIILQILPRMITRLAATLRVKPNVDVPPIRHILDVVHFLTTETGHEHAQDALTKFFKKNHLDLPDPKKITVYEPRIGIANSQLRKIFLLTGARGLSVHLLPFKNVSDYYIHKRSSDGSLYAVLKVLVGCVDCPSDYTGSNYRTQLNTKYHFHSSVRPDYLNEDLCIHTFQASDTKLENEDFFVDIARTNYGIRQYSTTLKPLVNWETNLTQTLSIIHETPINVKTGSNYKVVNYSNYRRFETETVKQSTSRLKGILDYFGHGRSMASAFRLITVFKKNSDIQQLEPIPEDDDSIRLYDCVDDNLEVLRKGGKCRCRVGFEVGFRTVFSSQSRICEAHWCMLRAIHARARPCGARFDEANGAVDSIGGIFVFKIIARCRRLQIACTSWTYTATNMFVYHLLRRRCGCNLHAWRHR